MRTIYFTNSGKRITDAELETIVQAYRQELPTFCAAWGVVPPDLKTVPLNATAPIGSEYVDFGDQPPKNENGVLGEHFEILGKARGTVYAGYELDNGGAVLNSPTGQGGTTVAAIGYHELTEQLMDPYTNAWRDGPITPSDGNTYASVVFEVGDPVEGDDGQVVQSVNGQQVWLCNTVLPPWFNPQATKGPFDRLGLLTAPFTLRSTGYVAVRNAPGTETQVFGEEMPAHRVELRKASWKARWNRQPTPPAAT